jgi:hypothetical protein
LPLLAVLASVLLAHTGEGTSRIVVIDGLSPELDGVGVGVQGSPATRLVVTNPGPEALIIADAHGRDFLRLDGDGVHADTASAAWHRGNDPFGAVQLSDGAPRWEQVAVGDTFAWFEHRLHPGAPDATPPPQEFWQVRGRLGDRPFTIVGHLLPGGPHGSHHARLDRRAEFPSNVRVAVTSGVVPGLHLSVSPPTVVEVEGADGEPFLRVTPDGVEANVASPTWFAHAQADPATAVPDRVIDPGAVDWRHVADAPAFTWWEPRIRPGIVSRTNDGTGAERVWLIPIDVDDDRYELRGVTEWTAFGGTGPWLSTSIVAVAIGAFVWAELRRRQRGPAAAPDRAEGRTGPTG